MVGTEPPSGIELAIRAPHRKAACHSGTVGKRDCRRLCRPILLILLAILPLFTARAADTNKVTNVKIDARLTVTTNLVFESESMTTRGGPMERTADYKLVELYIVKNTYAGRTWFTTNTVDTGLLVRRREVRGDGPNSWIPVPNP